MTPTDRTLILSDTTWPAAETPLSVRAALWKEIYNKIQVFIISITRIMEHIS